MTVIFFWCSVLFKFAQPSSLPSDTDKPVHNTLIGYQTNKSLRHHQFFTVVVSWTPLHKQFICAYAVTTIPYEGKTHLRCTYIPIVGKISVMVFSQYKALYVFGNIEKQNAIIPFLFDHLMKVLAFRVKCLLIHNISYSLFVLLCTYLVAYTESIAYIFATKFMKLKRSGEFENIKVWYNCLWTARGAAIDCNREYMVLIINFDKMTV